MAVRQECEHTEQFIICTTCDEGSNEVRMMLDDSVAEPPPGVVMTAQFSGQCQRCGFDVRGQRIVWHPDTGRTEHEECA